MLSFCDTFDVSKRINKNKFKYTVKNRIERIEGF